MDSSDSFSSNMGYLVLSSYYRGLIMSESHTYKVTVAQVVYKSVTFDIEASSQDEAEQFAKNKAWDSTDFKIVDSETFVNNCEVVK